MRKADAAYRIMLSGEKKMTTTLVRRSVKGTQKKLLKPVVTVFHCFNVLNDAVSLESDEYFIQSVKMPCSSMTREVFLLRAFEAGANAVVVLTCPEGACDYLEGNIRAQKRVERVKKILDEIGIGGQHLSFYNIPRGDLTAAEKIIKRTISELNNGA
jgi:F420-non-reducing hydrogenase iron-sulfur subunit